MPITFGAIKYGNDSDNEIYGTTSDDTIYAYGGNDYVDAGAGDDTVYGGDGNDYLWGGGGNDALYGGNDNDQLFGSSGDDRLDGGAGNDLLKGGLGEDTLTGGLGADTFVIGEVFNGANLYASTQDYITDFSHAQGDKIDVSHLDANTLVGGNQAFNFIGAGAFTGVAGQLRYEVHAVQAGPTNDPVILTAVQGDTDGDGVVDFYFNVAGQINFVASDFIL